MLPLDMMDRPKTMMERIPSAVYVLNWIFFSSIVILFNKWIISTAGFPYPVILTCWHLIFATILTQALARWTTLLDGRKEVRMTGRVYMRAIVPIGVLYSASLVCSNLVYLYLSVAFIQMLKAAAPASVLVVGYAFGTDTYHLNTLLNVLVIVFGVMLASYGELAFSLIGFLYQLGGLLFESIRLIMVQKLLNPVNAVPAGSEPVSQQDPDDVEGGKKAPPPSYKMDPLVSLYYYAPVCAVMNTLVALIVEAPSFDSAHISNVGIWVLLANAMVAFLLNVASVFLIGKTSSLVLTLCGVLKNCGIVFASILIFGTIITPLQWFGYSIATAGLIYYSLGWEGIKQVLTNGKIMWDNRSEKFRDKNLTIIIGIACAMIFVLFWVWSASGNPAAAAASTAQ